MDRMQRLISANEKLKDITDYLIEKSNDPVLPSYIIEDIRFVGKTIEHLIIDEET